MYTLFSQGAKGYTLSIKCTHYTKMIAVGKTELGRRTRTLGTYRKSMFKEPDLQPSAKKLKEKEFHIVVATTYQTSEDSRICMVASFLDLNECRFIQIQFILPRLS